MMLRTWVLTVCSPIARSRAIFRLAVTAGDQPEHFAFAW